MTSSARTSDVEQRWWQRIVGLRDVVPRTIPELMAVVAALAVAFQVASEEPVLAVLIGVGLVPAGVVVVRRHRDHRGSSKAISLSELVGVFGIVAICGSISALLAWFLSAIAMIPLFVLVASAPLESTVGIARADVWNMLAGAVWILLTMVFYGGILSRFRGLWQ